MTDLTAPALRPANPRFSSGPCAKIPGFSLSMLGDAPLGRSHRAAIGKAKLAEAIDLTREILAVPADYRIGIVPASDTGAVEMALWSLLGARPVEMLAWESFGEGWVTDVVKQLKLEAKVKIAPYGQIVDFTTVDFDSDLVFTWNGTTSGCRLPHGDVTVTHLASPRPSILYNPEPPIMPSIGVDKGGSRHVRLQFRVSEWGCPDLCRLRPIEKSICLI